MKWVALHIALMLAATPLAAERGQVECVYLEGTHVVLKTPALKGYGLEINASVIDQHRVGWSVFQVTSGDPYPVMIGISDCNTGDRIAVQPILSRANEIHDIYQAMLLTDAPTSTNDFVAEMQVTESWIANYAGNDGKSACICDWFADQKRGSGNKK